jgi:type II secretion system protein N
MTQTKKQRIKKAIGYSAFFSAAFLLMLHLTFPFDAVGDLVREHAKRSGIELTLGDVGPGLLGMKAEKITVVLPKKEGQPAAAAPEPLHIDKITARPSLFPPGVALSVDAFGGTINGSFGALGTPSLHLRAKGIDLVKSDSKAAIGLDLEGRLGGAIDLTMPEDSTKMSGRVSFLGDDLLIKGGTIGHYDLPKVELGKLEVDLKLDGGKATVQTFTANGSDLEGKIEGEASLAPKLPLSTLKLKMSLKPSAEFLKRNPIIQTGMSFAMAKDSRGFFNSNVGGALGNPRLTASR